MAKTYEALQSIIEAHVKALFEIEKATKLTYHQLTHTQEVVTAATEIANHYQLDDKNFFIVIASAWLHDTGYLETLEEHERKSAIIAREFLTANDVDSDVITAVENAIIATKLPQTPKNQNEQILCDADLFHLGRADFSERSKLLLQEIETTCGVHIGKKKWRQKDLEFLENHQYHTDYCKQLLSEQKQKNIKKLKKKMQEQAEEDHKKTALKNDVPAVVEIKEPKAKKDKDEPGRGVETLFRITSANNQRLSDMADNKAQILITVNSIILSLIVSLLLRRLEDNAYLVIPTFMLLMVSLLCIVFSILATRPSIPAGTFTNEDVDNKRVNLVFFGNFYKMSLDKYQDSMKKVMADKDFLYSTLVTDVYSQGVVLGKKYKLIRTAYNIFMFGLISTVLAYIISYGINGKLF